MSGTSRGKLNGWGRIGLDVRWPGHGSSGQPHAVNGMFSILPLGVSRSASGPEIIPAQSCTVVSRQGMALSDTITTAAAARTEGDRLLVLRKPRASALPLIEEKLAVEWQTDVSCDEE